jgi:AraC-like DNA-binding protein
MAENNSLLEGQNTVTAIGDEVVYVDNIQEVVKVTSMSPLKMEWNAIVHCRRGRILLEVGGNQEVKVHQEQLLLIPAQKLLQTMMVSTDIDAIAVLISDRVLKSVLGPQVDIWNRAMYLREIYVIDTLRWSKALQSQSLALFKGEELFLFHEFAFSFLRTFLLIICEELLRKEKMILDTFTDGEVSSTNRNKVLFSQFLELLRKEKQKRRPVSYYAARLCITSKYLSTLCRKVSGKTPTRWITDSVMEDSYQLLRSTNLTVKEISNRLGFPNSSFFGQYFREQAGLTPIEYRTQKQTKP